MYGYFGDATLAFARMDWSAQCAVVIPCLNEAATIEALIADIRAILPAVIVVDDGSTDGTADLAAKAGAEIIRHERPRGKGAALAAGWARARELDFQWALSMDGDGQHAPEDIPKFLTRAQAGDAPLVVGNRMMNPAGMPWVRRTVNRWMSQRISGLTGLALPDTQCGFRLMRLDAWARVHVQADHYEIESELLCKFIAAGCAVDFVPVRVIYRNERSKIQPVRDTRRWFRWWWQAQGWHRTRVLQRMTNDK
jgi:glycosyltransferase involved in cell wall biosynthesis